MNVGRVDFFEYHKNIPLSCYPWLYFEHFLVIPLPATIEGIKNGNIVDSKHK